MVVASSVVLRPELEVVEEGAVLDGVVQWGWGN